MKDLWQTRPFLMKGKDKKRASKKKTFDPNNSRFGRYVLKTFEYTPKLHELLPMAKLISGIIGKKLNRDCKRGHEDLYKWFDEHYDEIEPHLGSFAWEFSDKDIKCEKEGLKTIIESKRENSITSTTYIKFLTRHKSPPTIEILLKTIEMFKRNKVIPPVPEETKNDIFLLCAYIDRYIPEFDI